MSNENTTALNAMYDKAIDHAISIVERNRMDPDRIIKNLQKLKSNEPPQTDPPRESGSESGGETGTQTMERVYPTDEKEGGAL